MDEYVPASRPISRQGYHGPLARSQGMAVTAQQKPGRWLEIWRRRNQIHAGKLQTCPSKASFKGDALQQTRGAGQIPTRRSRSLSAPALITWPPKSKTAGHIAGAVCRPAISLILWSLSQQVVEAQWQLQKPWSSLRKTAQPRTSTHGLVRAYSSSNEKAPRVERPNLLRKAKG